MERSAEPGPGSRPRTQLDAEPAAGPFAEPCSDLRTALSSPQSRA